MYNDIFFAQKMDGLWWHLQPHLGLLKLYGPGPYFKVQIHEATSDEQSRYWAWKDFEKREYRNIWPSELQTKMCSPDFYQRAIDEGEGKLVNIVIKELEKIKD